MIIELLVLIVSLILLVRGSDIFVKSAAIIAKRLGVSEFFIGLTLIALGTSMPELVSAIFASVNRESALVMGNVIGANIANIGLILGLATMIAVIKTKKHMLERDGYFLLFAVIVLLGVTIDGSISRVDGIFFIILYVSYLLFIYESSQKYKGRYHFTEFIPYFYKFEYLRTIKNSIKSSYKNLQEGKKALLQRNGKRALLQKKSKASVVRSKTHSIHARRGSGQGAGKSHINWLLSSAILKNGVRMLFGLIAVMVGANYLIQMAVYFATYFNMSKTIIGVILAIGTTMPELSVALSASKRALGNVIMGNVIGSCITNTFLILGVAAIIFPLEVSGISKMFTIPFLLMMVTLLLLFLKTGWRVRKLEGVAFFVLYILFLLFMVFELFI
jgi:cation:H+ antiporter